MRRVVVDRRSALGQAAFRGVDLAERLTRPWQYRGFFKLARWLGRLTPPGQRCVVDLAPDARFAFLAADPYWNRLIAGRFDYERELHFVLRRIADVEYTFIDAGANYGYWSVLVTSHRYGAKPTVAIEPVTHTFRVLEENRHLNADRFEILQRALCDSERGDVVVRYAGAVSEASASASVVEGEAADDPESEMVPSTSIDAVLAEFAPAGEPVVLKLDVEGMEIPALQGARTLDRREWLVSYEDHGSDRSCRNTAFAMGLDASIFCADGGRVRRIKSLDQVRRVKSRRHRGYNFFAASRGGLFERRLDELAASGGAA